MAFDYAVFQLICGERTPFHGPDQGHKANLYFEERTWLVVLKAIRKVQDEDEQISV